jgi:hypothetical protein
MPAPLKKAADFKTREVSEPLPQHKTVYISKMRRISEKLGAVAWATRLNVPNRVVGR